MIKTPSKARAQAAHAGPVTGGAFTPPRPAAAKSGRWRDAEMVLDQSRRYKRSHIILYTSVIGACGRAREKGRALNHLARLREERGRADVFAFTAAVDACARAGKG